MSFGAHHPWLLCMDNYLCFFHRCSTNVAHWALPQFDSALAGLPVCGDFCEDWFDACAEDFTCATNWVTDWDFIEGINQCKPNSTCRNFRYNTKDKMVVIIV